MQALRRRLGAAGRCLVHGLATGALGLAAAACSSDADDVPTYGGAELEIAAVARPDDPRSLVFERALVSLRKVSLVPCAADAATVSTYDYPVNLFHDPP